MKIHIYTYSCHTHCYGYFYAILLLLATLCSCNSDIFVEPIPDQQVEDIWLECGGSPQEFLIHKKGLKDIDFYDNNGYLGFNPTVAFYDRKDKLLTHFSIDDVAKVVYYSPVYAVEFKVKGDHVFVSALANSLDYDYEFFVVLDYGYTTQHISVTIGKGTPLKLLNMGYSIHNDITGVKKEDGISQRFNNNTDKPQRMILYPFKDAKTKIVFTSDNSWTERASGEIYLPYYNVNKWIVDSKAKALVTIGKTCYYDAPTTDTELIEYVEVPPFSSAVAIMTVTYATYSNTCSFDTALPSGGERYTSWGNCEIAQPISYSLDVVIESL